MGQVSSSLATVGPIQISKQLELKSIVIMSGNSSRKLIQIMNQSIVLPSVPLSVFTQNEDKDEFPFLLNVEKFDKITLGFKLTLSLSSTDFDNKEMTLQLFKDIKARVYCGTGEVIEVPLLKAIEHVKTSKTTMDPNVVQVQAQNNDAVDIKLTLDLRKIQASGKVKVDIVGNNDVLVRFSCMVVSELMNMNDVSQTSGSSTDRLLTAAHMKELNSVKIYEYEPAQTKVKQLEANIIRLKPIVKNIIKKSQNFDESLRALAITKSSLANSLSDLSHYASTIDNDIVRNLLRDMSSAFTEQSTLDVKQSHNVKEHIIDPLVKLYNSDLKVYSTKKALFERRMAEINDSGNDLETQKEQYLEILSYQNYLNGVKNGCEIRELVYNFALFYKTSSPTPKYSLESSIVFHAGSELYRLEQDLLALSLRNCKSKEELEGLLTTHLHSSEKTSSRSKSGHKSKIPQPIDKDGKVKKSDMLYCLGDDGKVWERKYVIVKDNLLQEFNLPETFTNTPISKRRTLILSGQMNLSGGRVRKSDNMEGFCIQIITKTGVIRNFQLYNQAEQNSWIQLLIAATQLDTYDHRELRCTSQTSGLSPTNSTMVTESEQHNCTSSPLEIVRHVDASNHICCDCGSSIRVDWISLNLLVVVCIECAGAHRSLGMHISKVRSLTMDTKVLQNKDFRELLYHVSNRISNSFWMGSFNGQVGLSGNPSLLKRIEFLTKKYINRQFIQKDRFFKPEESLVKAVKSQNVPMILKSFCLGANANMKVIKNRGGETIELSLFEYSLAQCSLSSHNDSPTFHISQLLFLNSAEVGNVVDNVLPLNELQRRYWHEKLNEKFDYNSDQSLLHHRNNFPLENKPKGVSVRRGHSLRHVNDSTQMPVKKGEKNGIRRHLTLFRRK